MTLAVIATHPVQYHAPVYRAVQSQWEIPVVAIYESDFSVSGYVDKDFGVEFAWDSDLLSGYTPLFLSNHSRQGNNRATGPSVGTVVDILLQVSPSAILLQNYHGKFGWMTFRAARRIGAPLLFRAETTDHAFRRTRLKSKLRHWYLSWFYAHFDFLLPIGAHSYLHYLRHGVSASKLICSPYCVDTTVFQLGESAREELRASTRGELNIDDETLVLLFSGKLIVKKAPDLLLTAAARLASEISGRVAVLFLGDGEMRPSLTTFSAPNLLVRFLGFHNQTQLSRFFHAADLFVLPSRFEETWGLVVNEALHHGLPSVVSTAVGCAPDLVIAGETGEIFPVDSLDALVHALQKSILLTRRLDIRQRCQAQVANYSVQRASYGIAQAYTRVVTDIRQ